MLSLQFPLSALGKVHEYRIRASLDFKKLVRPFAVSTFVKGAVAVVAAAFGAGVWSLVIGQLAGTLVRSIWLWHVEPWRPRAVFSRTATPSLLKFGAGIVAVEILGQIAKSFDYLVVGAKIGATALGFYFLAFRLPELVVLGMFQVANEVLFPFYARLRESSTHGSNDELRDGYVRTVRLAAAIALPPVWVWPRSQCRSCWSSTARSGDRPRHRLLSSRCGPRSRRSRRSLVSCSRRPAAPGC